VSAELLYLANCTVSLWTLSNKLRTRLESGSDVVCEICGVYYNKEILQRTKMLRSLLRSSQPDRFHFLDVLGKRTKESTSVAGKISDTRARE